MENAKVQTKLLRLERGSGIKGCFNNGGFAPKALAKNLLSIYKYHKWSLTQRREKMKKNVYVKFMILLLCVFLAACSSKNETASVKNESEQDEAKQSKEEEDKDKLDESEVAHIVSVKEEHLRSEGDYGEYLDQLAVVNFFGSDVPQILTINEENSKSVVRVHTYRKAKKDWVIVYENSNHDSFDGLERLQIFESGPLKENTTSEQAIIGLVSGSGGFLNFYIIGGHEEKIVPFADKMSLNAPEGNVVVEGTDIIIESRGNVIEKFTIGEPMTENNKSEELAENDSTNSEQTTDNNKGFQTNWQSKIQEIAKLNISNMEKVYELGDFFNEYTPTEKEIHEFETYIIAEYKNGRYLSDINNDVYMLSNMFKARLVNEFYTEEQHSVSDFADYFMSNTHSIYTGIDAVGSSMAEHTEKKMDRALEDME
jgi:Na+-transporting methylmalonyl-CoA/oxaloacetate decarboxylase gamma subunit